MKRNTFLLLLLAFAALNAHAQVTGLEDLKKIRGASNEVIKAAKIDISNKTAFAMLNPEYPVTPGDTYTVQYLYNLKATSLPFFVENDCTANLSFFGKINVKGLSLSQLRVLIEGKVLKAYPDSLPRLVLESTGAFPVLVSGEVKIPGFAQAWGFSRLSDLIIDRLTAYSSIRCIDVLSENGEKKSYDLYQAALASDLTRNPVIHPGERIVVNRMEREIFVRGEVHREGAFQVLPDENLRTVLETYAAGLTSLSDPSQAYIIRLLADGGETETVYVDLSHSPAPDVPLKDMDIVVIPGRTARLPFVFFEGALFMKIGDKSPISARVPWPITRDQKVSTALLNLPAGAITPVSDLEHSFIVRRGSDTFTPVDLHRIFYEHDFSQDVVLQEGDRIVIPTRFFTVLVGGAVQSPGPQPYIAGKRYIEYVQAAGGFDTELTTGKRVVIMDREGKQQKPDRIIQPEDKIYIAKDSFNYLFTKRLGPIIVTFAAIVGLVVSVGEIYSYFHN